MDNLSLVKKLPPMLSGRELEQALTILPEYDPDIVNQSDAVRLVALSDIYKVFVPTQMAREIYTRMYLSLLRSMQKKESKLAVKQYMENHRAVRQQSYSGIIGGSDSFTIIGASGIGKSSAITRAIQLLTTEEVIEVKKPYISVPTKSQTSTVRDTQQLPLENHPVEDDVSISSLILRAKNECSDIVSFLQRYITVEVISV